MTGVMKAKKSSQKQKKSRPAKTLDLHGYATADVFDAVDRFLLSVARSGASRARIMTGKGTGQVRQVVVDYLKKAGYPWSHETTPSGQKNEGVLVIFMD